MQPPSGSSPNDENASAPEPIFSISEGPLYVFAAGRRGRALFAAGARLEAGDPGRTLRAGIAPAGDARVRARTRAVAQHCVGGIRATRRGRFHRGTHRL